MPITDVIQQLLIVKGIAPAVGDTGSAEQGLTSVDLMTQTQQSGFSLDAEDGWNPAIASLKGGGVWADSAVSSGRQLLSNEEANVVETMQLSVTGLNVPDLAAHLSKLAKMIADARDFWATFWQIEPVYLRWQAVGAPGPQFALIYNIEMAIVEPTDFTATGRDLTLTIEREPYWRPIPPGANPKLWSAEVHGLALTDLTLFPLGVFADALQHLVKDNNVDNRREWNTTQTGILSRNYLDIPANLIHGDAPALLCLVSYPNNTLIDSLIIARQTKSTALKSRVDGANRESVIMLNAGDSASQTNDTSIAADTGAPASNSSASGQRSATTFATVTAMAERINWSGGATETPLDLTLQRGIYAAFLRCRISAASTVDLRLTYGDFETTIINETKRLTDVGSSGTGNTTEWAFVYMGQVKIPFARARASVNLDGKGLNVISDDGSTNNLIIAIEAQRVGAATNLYMADLFLAPFDECAVILSGANNNDLSGMPLVYDNTGYFLHGEVGVYSEVWLQPGSGAVERDIVEIVGGELTLLPGVKNRLHFLAYDRATMRSAVGKDDIQTFINIVPRWRGVRDV